MRTDRVWRPPRLAQLEAHRWITTHSYRIAGHRRGLPRVVIPAGFVFDGASIPRPLWIYHHPMGSALKAGLVHDWRYWIHDIPRELADDEFYWNLVATGHSEADAFLMWKAVRVGGSGIWTVGATAIAAGLRVADPFALRQGLRVALQAGR